MSTLFEAVVFRYVPDQGSGEALNVGVAMRTTDGTYFRVKLLDSWTRITNAFPAAHAPTIRATFSRVRDALERLSSPHPLLPFPSSFAEDLRRLVPSSDGFIQWSSPLEGETSDPEATFARLMERYVNLHLQERPDRRSRSDDEVRATFEVALERRAKLKTKLTPRTLVAKGLKHFEVEVQHAWKNGRWNCLQPVSFDLLNARDITQKAAQVAGSVNIVAPSKQDAHMILFVALPPASRPDALEAAEEAIEGFRQVVAQEADVYLESQTDSLLDRIENDLH